MPEERHATDTRSRPVFLEHGLGLDAAGGENTSSSWRQMWKISQTKPLADRRPGGDVTRYYTESHLH